MPLHYKIIIFVIVTLGFIWLSWSSLRDLRSHGFYRFFGFETIAAIVLVNLDIWFTDPFSLHQMISWFLFVISILLLIHGVLLLHSARKPGIDRDDPSLIGIEKTTELITHGAYRFIRHPVYSAGIIATWGIFLKQPSLVGGLLAVLTTIFFTMTARKEEAENTRFFGEAYQAYMKRTKMFIPYLF